MINKLFLYSQQKYDRSTYGDLKSECRFAFINFSGFHFFRDFNQDVEHVAFDFHKIGMTKIKTSFNKLKPKIICYRKNKHFSSDF